MYGNPDFSPKTPNNKSVAKQLLWIVLFLLVVLPLACAVVAHGQEVDPDQLVLTSAIVSGANMAPSYLSEEQEPFVTVSGGASLWNQYLGSTGGLFYDGPVLQGNVTLEFRGGAYFDLWGSRADSGSWLDTFGDEVDVTFGYMPNDHFDVGAAYIVASTLSSSDVGWAYVRLYTGTLTERGWSLEGYLKVDRFWPVEGTLPLSGWNFHAGATLSQEWEKWSASQDVELLYDTGAFGAGEGFVCVVKAEIIRDVGGTAIGLGMKYSRGVNLPEWDDRDGDVAVGLLTRF